MYSSGTSAFSSLISPATTGSGTANRLAADICHRVDFGW